MTHFLPALVLALGVRAQLAPEVSAPLARHLVEVNAQWKVQGHLTTAQDGPAHFANEAQRIATHLHLVREYLAGHIPEGMDSEQVQHRLGLLNDLASYADAGRFPRNQVVAHRNPVFIDPDGTPCAVGQLMIASGHADLAQRIDRGMELAYVLDMEWPEIATWASEHGFTAQELAWIQPGYPPEPLPFTPLGGGTNGPVKVVVEMPGGDLFLGGEFTEAGGTAAVKAARWNGTSYSSLGSGLSGEVTCAVMLGSDLYVGGWQLNGVNDLARWDGSNWSFSTVFEGKSPRINALHVHNGVLYAAGESVGFVGVTDLVMRRTGTDWNQVGSSFNGSVLALGTHNGVLVAGGAFTVLESASMPAVLHMAELEGNEWGQLADGLDNTVRVLRTINDTLYAGGDLFANVLPTFGLARIAQGGPTWEPLLPGHVYYIPDDGMPSYIDAIAAHGDDIYFGGRFPLVQIMTDGNNLALLQGVDMAIPQALMDGAVHALLILGDRLVVAGDMTTNVGQPMGHVAVLDLVTGMTDPEASGTLRTYPQPVVNELFVEADGADLSGAAVGVLDMAGRRLDVPMERQGDRIRLAVGALPAGSYMVRAAKGQKLWTARFIKP